jgi:hypothetical protein
MKIPGGFYEEDYESYYLTSVSGYGILRLSEYTKRRSILILSPPS